jgi:hypothetical protein
MFESFIVLSTACTYDLTVNNLSVNTKLVSWKLMVQVSTTADGEVKKLRMTSSKCPSECSMEPFVQISQI